MTLFTIGFTQSTAEDFFGRLEGAGVRRLIDVRLSNTSQLAGFAKTPDLAFFARRVAGLDYVHAPDLAPDEALFDAFKKKKSLSWADFSRRFLDLMADRHVEREYDPGLFEAGCLLCSEHEAHHCHRALVAGYLTDAWGGGLTVRHL